MPAVVGVTLRLNLNPLDYGTLMVYFGLVVVIGALARRSIATNEDFLLSDLRILIGGLFSLYGAVLTVAGILASAADLHKAAEVNINLWMGLGMLGLGLLFLARWRLQPIRPTV